jgi:hypothetical protein
MVYIKYIPPYKITLSWKKIEPKQPQIISGFFQERENAGHA